MAAQYLLPCECGKTTPIDVSQAGSSAVCECGKRLEVPSLRAIRELEPYTAEAAPSSYDWSPAAGMMFGIGLIVALIGAGTGYFMHTRSSSMANIETPSQEAVTAWVNEIDTLPPDELIEQWDLANEVGLGRYEASPYIQARAIAEQFALYRNVGLIVMGTGLAFALTSIFLRRKSA